ncbi:elongation factor G [Caenispirillum bisanense]|uniref:Elongation factor G n=1 Tax=Caenispirillum bisanense TaxID=414052 RepID=A0A286G406_9PROT|nr:elongation factor G [Caenispirillum bisanense]SOD90280.1 translation elongation factor 2 (EF-2/EF-G) [Caenispirillum bisanense]
MVGKASSPRVAALVGPYMGGKTTLLESILHAAGATHRRGSVTEKSSVGDASPEARDKQMGVEVTVASCSWLDEPWTFLDCPGSTEFLHDALAPALVADVAVVVCDPEPERAVMVAPILKALDDRQIPHIVFINKVDHHNVDVRAALEALQVHSERPLVLREVPIKEGDDIVGYVDLVSERAYRYKPGEPSDLIKIPDAAKDVETSARQEMLETLADFDDHLMEELLEEVVPPKEEVYADLAKDLEDDKIVPVFFGSADKSEGVRRLLKALRHEVPGHQAAALRMGIDLDAAGDAPLAQVFKTVHAPHAGKLSYVRVWNGAIKDGSTVETPAGKSNKVTGVFTLFGAETRKTDQAVAGEVVALGRLEDAATGMLVGSKPPAESEWLAPLPPLFALALRPSKQGDDVKLSGALQKLCEEDPSLAVEQSADTGELLLWGQGDTHLQVAMAKLARVYHVEVETAQPQVPYRETIRKGTQVQGRHKRQTGGHGQFGDVHVRIKPLPRGEGFVFSDHITGGVVPRQYIPAVEQGVREYLVRGPLGFPVVDVAVELFDGSYHTVDSSEMAFKTAAQLAMREGMPQCDPLLLEPMLMVEVSVPTEYTSKAQRALSSRRGQILGFDRRQGWETWDTVTACVPQGEMHDLIVELRSVTMGVGTFSWRFERLQEVQGKTADQVVEKRKQDLVTA